MHRDHALFDGDLAKLDASLRSGDMPMARLHLAAFDLELLGYVRGEERVLFSALERVTAVPFAPIAKMRQEHASLRRLVTILWGALDRADERQSLDLLGTLRSLLLLHVTKEDWILSPMYSRAVG